MEPTPATILMAEDDRNSAMLLKELLTKHGHRVIAVASGLAAIQAAAQEPIDLAMLDLRLPEENGFVIAETIRRNEATAYVPIIVVSAYNDRQNRLRAYRSGINFVLSKPIDAAELVLLVSNLLAVTRRRPSAQ